MKNLSPRQRDILKLVTRKGDATIDDIRQAIGISQATAYRETQVLIQTGLVSKIPGGISLAVGASTGCIQCGQEGNPRVTFLIEKKDGSRATACCPHCGLMALTRRDDISTAMATDFFNGRLLNANQAWYVLDSEISLCCSPSVLCFLLRDHAERFSRGFGGDVMDFTAAQKKVGRLMSL